MTNENYRYNFLITSIDSKSTVPVILYKFAIRYVGYYTLTCYVSSQLLLKVCTKSVRGCLSL